MSLLLEIARGLAALWVFAYHVKGLFAESSPWLHALAAQGHCGVPMFFVISGYVITCSAEAGRRAGRSPWHFLKNRFLRIYPAFWASVIVVLLVPYVMEAAAMLRSGRYEAPPPVLGRLDAGEWLHLLLLSKVFFARSADLQSEFNAVNSVYWTLAIEFQFYLVVFALLWARRHFRALLGLVTLLAFVDMVHPLGLSPGLFLAYWPSFALGIGLAYLQRADIGLQRWLPPGALVPASAGLGLVAGAVALRPAAGAGSFAFALAFALSLWLVAPLEGVLQAVRGARSVLLRRGLEGLLALGAMSYTVYLLHGKLYQLPHMAVRQLLAPDRLAHGLLIIGLTLLLCLPFHRHVERRFMSAGTGQQRPQRLTAAPRPDAGSPPQGMRLP